MEISAATTSAGRFHDGTDTDSNCNDFLTQAAATLSAASAAGATNIKVASVKGFDAGQKIIIDSGTNRETAVIATVGTAGAATVQTATRVGATMVPVEADLLLPLSRLERFAIPMSAIMTTSATITSMVFRTGGLAAGCSGTVAGRVLIESRHG